MAGSADTDRRAVLLDACDRTLDRIANLNLLGGFIHGDAQRKNAMWDGETVRWIDLEECSIGPFGWDLACFVMNPQYGLSTGPRARHLAIRA